jgi:hypothetical protein
MHWVRLPLSFGGMGHFSMENYAPFTFPRSWALVIRYSCFKFHIFDKLVLEEYFFRLRGPPLVLVIFTCNVKWPFSCS